MLEKTMPKLKKHEKTQEDNYMFVAKYWKNITGLNKHKRIITFFQPKWNYHFQKPNYHNQRTQVSATFFSECLARVPVSLWGSGAWGCVRSTWCLQPSTTVLNRPGAVAWGPYGRAHGKFCEMWSLLESFGGFRCFFRRRVASFHLAWHFVTFRCVS